MRAGSAVSSIFVLHAESNYANFCAQIAVVVWGEISFREGEMAREYQNSHVQGGLIIKQPVARSDQRRE